jgi:hypothetical protein
MGARARNKSGANILFIVLLPTLSRPYADEM